MLTLERIRALVEQSGDDKAKMEYILLCIALADHNIEYVEI